MASEISGNTPYIRSAPIQSGGFLGIGQTEKVASLDDALKIAQENEGSEAIIKHETKEGVFYTVHEVDQKAIRDFNQTTLEPNLMCFSIDHKKGDKAPEEVVKATDMAAQNLTKDLDELKTADAKKISAIPRLNRAIQTQGFRTPEQFQLVQDLTKLFNSTGTSEQTNALARQFGFTDYADFEQNIKLLSSTAKEDLQCAVTAFIKGCNEPDLGKAVNAMLKEQLKVAMTLAVLPDATGMNATTVADNFTTAFDNALGKSLVNTPMTPALRDSISQRLGFRDFSAFKAGLATLNNEQLLKVMAILCDKNNLNKDSITGEIHATGASHKIAAYLNAQVNAIAGKELKLKPAGTEWSAAGMMAVFDAFQKLKTNTPDQLQTATGLTYTYDANPPNPGKPRSENPAQTNMIDILTNSMYIAHTATGDNEVIIHDGAITGDARKLIDQESKLFAEKLDIFNRDIYDYVPNTVKDLGPQVYRQEEMQERGLISADNTFDRAAAVALFKTLTVQDPKAKSINATTDEQRIFNQAYALTRSIAKFEGDIGNVFPSLKGLFEQKPDGSLLMSDKSLSALYAVFFDPKKRDPETIKAIEADLAKIFNNPAQLSAHSKKTNNILCDAVFMAEQMNEGRNLQQFLNQINPSGAKDLLVDGVKGDNTKAAIERLQFTVMAKIIENKLPVPMSKESQAGLKEIYAHLQKSPLDTAALQHVLDGLITRELSGDENKDLKITLSKTLEYYSANGTFNQQTAQGLIKSWLQLVDSNREGNIGSDLLLHEIGHNVMSNVLAPGEFQSIQEDWDAMGGFDPPPNDESYDMAAALEATTQSFFTKGAEEVSDYGQSSGYEDFAETFRMYNANPTELLASAPTKFMMMNALVNQDPQVAQAKLNGLLADLKKEGRITDTAAFIKPSLDKIMGYARIGTKGFVSPQMFNKLTSTYCDQFQTYTPPVDLNKSGKRPQSLASTLTKTFANVLTKSVHIGTGVAQHIRHLPGHDKLTPAEALKKTGLTETQYAAIISATEKLLALPVPAPVGTNYDEQKLKDKLGQQLYDNLPESFKVMLSNQDSSLLTACLTDPQHMRPAPEMFATQLLNECIDRQSASRNSKNNIEKMEGKYISSVAKLYTESISAKAPGEPSYKMQGLIDAINQVLSAYNQSHLNKSVAAPIEMNSPQLKDFLEQLALPNADFMQCFKSSFGIK